MAGLQKLSDQASYASLALSSVYYLFDCANKYGEDAILIKSINEKIHQLLKLSQLFVLNCF